jgi:hypothetical protein
LRELAGKTGEVTAFESVIRAELEEEQHRMEEIEQELVEEPLGGPQSTVPGSVREEAPPAAGDGAQRGAEPRFWWRRMFGG